MRRRYNLLFFFFMTILSMYPIAIGLKFIVAYYQHRIYIPNLFDTLFDWCILLLYGLISFIYYLMQYVRLVKDNE